MITWRRSERRGTVDATVARGRLSRTSAAIYGVERNERYFINWFLPGSKRRQVSSSWYAVNWLSRKPWSGQYGKAIPIS